MLLTWSEGIGKLRVRAGSALVVVPVGKRGSKYSFQYYCRIVNSIIISAENEFIVTKCKNEHINFHLTFLVVLILFKVKPLSRSS